MNVGVDCVIDILFNAGYMKGSTARIWDSRAPIIDWINLISEEQRDADVLIEVLVSMCLPNICCDNLCGAWVGRCNFS